MHSSRIAAPWQALTGFAFALPFVVMNAIVAQQIQPFFSFVRPGAHTGPVEYALLAVVLLLLPAGAYVSMLPALRPAEGVSRSYPAVNVLIAALLLASFALLAVVLGVEVFRCDVLGMPNCD